MDTLDLPAFQPTEAAVRRKKSTDSSTSHGPAEMDGEEGNGSAFESMPWFRTPPSANGEGGTAIDERESDTAQPNANAYGRDHAANTPLHDGRFNFLAHGQQASTNAGSYDGTNAQTHTLKEPLPQDPRTDHLDKNSPFRRTKGTGNISDIDNMMAPWEENVTSPVLAEEPEEVLSPRLEDGESMEDTQDPNGLPSLGKNRTYERYLVKEAGMDRQDLGQAASQLADHQVNSHTTLHSHSEPDVHLQPAQYEQLPRPLRFCTRCGQQNEVGVNFCGYCGLQLAKSPTFPSLSDLIISSEFASRLSISGASEQGGRTKPISPVMHVAFPSTAGGEPGNAGRRKTSVQGAELRRRQSSVTAEPYLAQSHGPRPDWERGRPGAYEQGQFDDGQVGEQVHGETAIAEHGSQEHLMQPPGGRHVSLEATPTMLHSSLSASAHTSTLASAIASPFVTGIEGRGPINTNQRTSVSGHDEEVVEMPVFSYNEAIVGMPTTISGLRGSGQASASSYERQFAAGQLPVTLPEWRHSEETKPLPFFDNEHDPKAPIFSYGEAAPQNWTPQHPRSGSQSGETSLIIDNNIAQETPVANIQRHGTHMSSAQSEQAKPLVYSQPPEYEAMLEAQNEPYSHPYGVHSDTTPYAQYPPPHLVDQTQGSMHHAHHRPAHSPVKVREPQMEHSAASGYGQAEVPSARTSRSASIPTTKERVHPVFAFGFGGRIMYSLPLKQSRYLATTGQTVERHYPGAIKVTTINHIAPIREEGEGLPQGPFTGKTRPKDVVSALNKYAEKAQSDEEGTLVRLISLLIGGKQADFKNAIPRSTRSATLTQNVASVDITANVVNGEYEAACKEAIRSGSYGLAFALAGLGGHVCHEQAMAAFIASLPIGHPLRLVLSIQNGIGIDVNEYMSDWSGNLRALLSLPQIPTKLLESMAEALRTCGQTEAAACVLVCAGAPKLLPVSMDLNELYEYGLLLNNGNHKGISDLAIHKLRKAERTADCGDIPRAMLYCNSLEATVDPALKHQLTLLVDRLEQAEHRTNIDAAKEKTGGSGSSWSNFSLAEVIDRGLSSVIGMEASGTESAEKVKKTPLFAPTPPPPPPPSLSQEPREGTQQEYSYGQSYGDQYYQLHPAAEGPAKSSTSPTDKPGIGQYGYGAYSYSSYSNAQQDTINRDEGVVKQGNAPGYEGLPQQDNAPYGTMSAVSAAYHPAKTSGLHSNQAGAQERASPQLSNYPPSTSSTYADSEQRYGPQAYPPYLGTDSNAQAHSSPADSQQSYSVYAASYGQHSYHQPLNASEPAGMVGGDAPRATLPFDDGDDDAFVAKNKAPAIIQPEAARKPADRPQPHPAQQQMGKKGVFSMLKSFISGGGDSKSPQSPTRANLGEQSRFRYDAALGRWVEEGAGSEANASPQMPAFPPRPNMPLASTPSSDYSARGIKKHFDPFGLSASSGGSSAMHGMGDSESGDSRVPLLRTPDNHREKSTAGMVPSSPPALF